MRTARQVVGKNGHVVIAKPIRDSLGLAPGWISIQRLVDDHVELYFLPPDPPESLKGCLAPYSKAHIRRATLGRRLGSAGGAMPYADRSREHAHCAEVPNSRNHGVDTPRPPA